MFVLNHTSDVVRSSDNPYLGVMLFAALIIIIAVSTVLIVKDMHK